MYWFVVSACSVDVMPQSTAGSQLVGSWTLERYDVVVTRTLSRARERIFLRERHAADSMNLLLERGYTSLRCEFHIDSSYSYKQVFKKRVEYFERGTWSIRDSSIQAYSITHDERSMIDGCRIEKINEQELVLVFRLGKTGDGLYQHLRFRRRSDAH